MKFVLKKIKSIAIGSSIFLYINSCGKDPSDLSSSKNNSLWKQHIDNGGAQQADNENGETFLKKEEKKTNEEYSVDLFIPDDKEETVIDINSYVSYVEENFFPIRDDKSFPARDHHSVIQNAGNVSWSIGGGNLNGACKQRFVIEKPSYDLYEIVAKDKIKKQGSLVEGVLSGEELERLDGDKKIQTQYCDLFLFENENEKKKKTLGCKLILMSNESIAKDKNNYNFMLYQVGPAYCDYASAENKLFFTDLEKSNESYYRLIEKNKELLKGRTIYYSGVSNGIFASRLGVILKDGKMIAVENVINAFCLKKFINANPNLGIKIVLNKDTSLAYSFIQDMTDDTIRFMVESAKQMPS